MAAEAAAYVARRLDVLAEEGESGWTGAFAPETGFRFEREVRGVRQVSAIDPALLDSADARKLDQLHAEAAAGLLRRRRSSARRRSRR